MAAAEDERAGSVEGVEKCKPRRSGQPRSPGSASRKKKREQGASPHSRDSGISRCPDGVGRPVRQSQRPARPPSDDRPDLCDRGRAEEDDTAATTAIDARSRSGQSVRAMPQTACATMATAAASIRAAARSRSDRSRAPAP